MLTSLIPRPFVHSLAARERAELCDLALSLGGAEPTLCGGWSVKDLVVHLLVRERRPWSQLVQVVPPLASASARASSELGERDLDSLVTQLRAVPLPLAVVDPALNGMEMFVHHEDVRRAQPTWTARTLSEGDERHLWLAVSTVGRLQARRAGVPLVVVAGQRRAVLRRGDAPVTVTGPVSEILLFLCGRSATTGLSFDGSAERIAQLQATQLSV
ncbi:TIGR03085 family metal-binding protein [Nocardioides panacihumi]|uniref:TIGR03085 family metal-binding protein n=1 Tax=Nocardioides panacihumi TaxID=400774 RepID=UPI0031D2BD26